MNACHCLALGLSYAVGPALLGAFHVGLTGGLLTLGLGLLGGSPDLTNFLPGASVGGLIGAVGGAILGGFVGVGEALAEQERWKRKDEEAGSV